MKENIFKCLLLATGLKYHQAGELLGCSERAARSWAEKTRPVPDYAVDGLVEYYERMTEWAHGQSWPVPDVSTDSEAKQYGFYSVNSYRIAAAMVFLSS